LSAELILLFTQTWGAERDDKMTKYSAEFKEKIAQKMMPPNSASIAQIHREAGVSKPTLRLWKNTFQ
jgi:transposase-like protein